MTLPTGQISMSQVNVELGRPPTQSLSLNDPEVRILAGKPSGQISMADLRGKTWIWYGTIGGHVSNFDLRSWALQNGWNGTSKVVVTINGGIYVWAYAVNGAPQAALNISGSFPNGIELINNGYIVGLGGGQSGYWNGGGNTIDPDSSANAGPALYLGTNVTVTNNGYIAGGGGAGAPMIAKMYNSGNSGIAYGGGGGGGGGCLPSLIPGINATPGNVRGGGIGGNGTGGQVFNGQYATSTPAGGGGAGGGGGSWAEHGVDNTALATASSGGGGGRNIPSPSGGGGSSNTQNITSGGGGSYNNAGGDGFPTYGAGGGGGYGARGGNGYVNGSAGAGSPGANAIQLNGYQVTFKTQGNIWGAVS